jgi:hypothetical protein
MAINLDQAGSQEQLTQLVVKHNKASTDFVASSIFPSQDLAGQSPTGKFYIGSGATGSVSTQVTAQDKYPTINLDTGSSIMYDLEDYGLGANITRKQVDTIRDPFQIQKIATETLSSYMLISREQVLSGLLLDDSKYTPTTAAANLKGLTGNACWDMAASTPIEDMNTAFNHIRQRYGDVNLKVIMPFSIFNKLSQHTALKEAFYTNSKGVSLPKDQVAAQLGLAAENLVVTKATILPQTVGENIINPWGNNVIVVAAPSSATNQVTTGIYFHDSSRMFAQAILQAEPHFSLRYSMSDLYQFNMIGQDKYVGAYRLKDVLTA